MEFDRRISKDYIIRFQTRLFHVLETNKPLPRTEDKVLVRIKLDNSVHITLIAQLDFYVGPLVGGGYRAYIQDAGFIAYNLGGDFLVFDNFYRSYHVLPLAFQNRVKEGAELFLVPLFAHDFEEHIVIERV
jgi:hypothetical protein